MFTVYRVHIGKFELKSRTFQGLLKIILPFSRTKKFIKNPDLSVKILLQNARLR